MVGMPELVGGAFGVDLVAETLDDFPTRADEGQGPVAVRGPAGETVILGKEAVARMDGGAAGVIGHRQDIVGFGVAGYPPGVLAGAKGDIALDMLGILVGLGVDHGVIETEILAVIHDPDGDFSPVGDKNLSFQTVPRMV